MALTSPGVEVTVIDESQYVPSAVNTVPYFVFATAQNKVSSDGITVAAGTLAANANKTYLITSQRDLAQTFGVPFFYNTTTGTPINGYELNEYGLLAAYSALGVTNRAYIQRADVDLTALTASLTRPLGTPANGTYWLDTGLSTWGMFEWNATTETFDLQTPIIITDTTDTVGGDGSDQIADSTPLTTIGSIGEYAVSAVNEHAFVYYKRSYPTIPATTDWVQVGSDGWKTAWPTVAGTNAVTTTLTVGANMIINGVTVTVGATNTVAGFAAVINATSITGVTAQAVSNQLYLYATSAAGTDGSTLNSDGFIEVLAGPNLGTALLTQLGITASQYPAPQYFAGYSYQQPKWISGAGIDPLNARPTGSVWQNMSSANNGLQLIIKQYSAALGTFITQSCPAYDTDSAALYGIDPTGGGKNIPAGTTYVEYTSFNYDTVIPTAAFTINERYAAGATIITGTTVPAASDTTPFTVGNNFSVNATAPGTATVTQGVATIGGTGTVSDFITAVSAVGNPYVTASVNSAGNIVFTHSAGGTIYLQNITGTPVTTAGFAIGAPDQVGHAASGSALRLSNFVSTPLFEYTASSTAPDSYPADGRLWYYSAVDAADIMIQDDGAWQGYQNVTNDVRGYDLTECNATGPIISATAPTTQTNTSLSPLVNGDLWIDTSDLENYPKLYRWQAVSGVQQWVEIDTTDQTTQNGILFADARWSTNGTTDPSADPLPSIVSLLTSNYLDPDAPNPALYPQGTLLFNTRRSGYNVKTWQQDYFTTTATDYAIDAYSTTTAYAVNDFVSYSNGIYVCAVATTAGIAPSNTAYWDLIDLSTWLTASGNKSNGSMWSGRLAQRQIIVEAMKSGIDTSVAAREEQNQYNIIATPAYPELTPNMIALSNERNNTLFVVGDTPMRLGPDGNSLVAFATNNNGLGQPNGDGNILTSNYCGVFYPSCQTTDLGGNTVVQPPSHMMVRTILRSDAASYPWLAPAGTRRGVVDNALAIGYIEATTGEFTQIGVSQSVRDILYERNINPITFIPGIGITNFGNKTSTTTTTALDRINVARLVAFLRGRLEEIGKLYLFEPNDTITRNQITNSVNSLMIDLVAKRALYDYLVVCDLSNNTPARIDRNELWVDVAIEPVKAVEFIYIPLRIKNTGAIAAGG
ncbi:phage tail sheath C-terminal domain-containing protein [Haliscomenobacter sp.]|uniref:phage tail sheath C-terminal domain-containing protein n=1 Tax=Haliscomenobacter sp. TaxID=2717303 RepID=UPI003364E619